MLQQARRTSGSAIEGGQFFVSELKIPILDFTSRFCDTSSIELNHFQQLQKGDQSDQSIL